MQPRRGVAGVRAPWLAAAALLAWFFDEPAAAQVNVEPVRAQLEETGRTFHVRGSLSAYQGNTSGVTLAVGGLVGWSSELQLVYLTASGDYSRLNYVTSVAKAFAHVRYNRRLLEGVYGEAFVQWEIDRFRRISSRELAGVGPRFRLADSDLVTLHCGTAYMLELTQRRQADAARDVVAHRWNNYATLNYSPHDNVMLSETLYFQPRFDAFGDYFLLSILSAHFRVTPVLSSGIDLRIRRESNAPAGVEPTDAELVSSLSLTF